MVTCKLKGNCFSHGSKIELNKNELKSNQQTQNKKTKKKKQPANHFAIALYRMITKKFGESVHGTVIRFIRSKSVVIELISIESLRP